MKDLSVINDKQLDLFYRTVSSNIKKIRKEKNKPQLDLVLEMGLKSTSFYSKCENNKDNHHFNLEHIFKIAVILGVDINKIFTDIETISFLS